MPEQSRAASAPASDAADPEAILRAEADERAHDRLTPDAALDAVAAVDLYVEAFLAGARFAGARAGART